jgi:hypothetical protein
MERSFFEQVLDVFEGVVAQLDGELHSYTHRRGLKVWFGESTREHYEAQLIRVDDQLQLEIGFHAEHPKPNLNDAVLDRLRAEEQTWRTSLGDDPEVGPFIGNDGWRRISEVWEPPEPMDTDAAIEIAARLADYVLAIEGIRRVGAPAI